MKKIVAGNKLLLASVLFLYSIFFSLNVFSAPPNEITVSAAASLKNAFEDMGKAFETQNKGMKVYLNFASSGDLKKQIEAGAPVDVFASAAQREMDDLERKGGLVAGSRYNFAGNEMVLVKPSASTIQLKSFNDLTRQEVKKIGIGNPSSVPAGMYAEQVLKYYGVWETIKDKLIFGESVRQVLDYVARGEVDAGVVFSTDALVRSKDVVVVMKAPEGSHVEVVYPISAVKNTKNEKIAKSFVDFVMSNTGIRILAKYGFKASVASK
jgi:molybdate transport system substrate-binding protein